MKRRRGKSCIPAIVLYWIMKRDLGLPLTLSPSSQIANLHLPSDINISPSNTVTFTGRDKLQQLTLFVTEHFFISLNATVLQKLETAKVDDL